MHGIVRWLAPGVTTEEVSDAWFSDYINSSVMQLLPNPSSKLDPKV
jgi:hypothetical protein